MTLLFHVFLHFLLAWLLVELALVRLEAPARPLAPEETSAAKSIEELMEALGEYWTNRRLERRLRERWPEMTGGFGR